MRQCALRAVVVLCVVGASGPARGASFETTHAKYKETKAAHEFWQVMLMNDNPAGYAHTQLSKGTIDGEVVKRFTREGALFVPGTGVVQLKEMSYWTSKYKPIAHSYEETIGARKRTVRAEYAGADVIVKESTGAGPAQVTKLPMPEFVVMDIDLYAFCYKVDDEPHTCVVQVFDARTKKFDSMRLNVGRKDELDYGEKGTKKVICVESDHQGGITYFFEQGTSHFVQADYAKAPLCLITSGDNAPKSFYGSTILTNDLVERARAAWKQNGNVHSNDVLGISLSLASEWQAQQPANTVVLKRVHGTLGSMFIFAAESVGDAWKLDECAKMHEKNLRANEAIRVTQAARTTLAGRKAYRYSYTFTTEGTKVPLMRYLVINRGALFYITWVLEPKNKMKCQADLGRTVRSMRFRK